MLWKQRYRKNSGKMMFNSATVKTATEAHERAAGWCLCDLCFSVFMHTETCKASKYHSKSAGVQLLLRICKHLSRYISFKIHCLYFALQAVFFKLLFLFSLKCKCIWVCAQVNMATQLPCCQLGSDTGAHHFYGIWLQVFCFSRAKTILN